MADYYMLAGIVYQAPDLCSVFNSRLVGMTVLFSCYYRKKKFEFFSILNLGSYDQGLETTVTLL